jgi:hypothetical protein
MNEETKENIYKGFDLDDFINEDKVRAVIDHLDLTEETATITENGDNYEVNTRQVKHGSSPETCKKETDLLKALLTPNKIKQIEAIINLDFVSKGTRDKVYKSTTDYLDKYKKDREEYKELDEMAGYVSNTVYHLLEKTGTDYVLMMQEAFLNKKVNDRRQSYTQNDGEYLVLDDDEAEKAWSESIENYYEEYIEPNLEGNLSAYFDYQKWERDAKMDGRGHSLNHYDGSEDEVTVDGTDYYIYRVN